MIGALGKRSFLPVPTHIDGTAPLVYYDAQDYNLKRNFGVTDGGGVLTHKNKGSLGSALDATQATSGARWIFRKVGVVGKIKGLSALENDGARRMAPAAFTNLPQPMLLVTVMRLHGLGTEVLFGGGWEIYCSPLSANFYAGTFQGGPASITADTFHTFAMVGNGVSGSARLDGAAVTKDLGTGGMTGLMIGSDGASTYMTGFFESLLIFGGALANLPSQATINAWVAAKIGATPQ